MKFDWDRQTMVKRHSVSFNFYDFLSSIMDICFLEIYLLFKTISLYTEEPTTTAGGSFTSFS